MNISPRHRVLTTLKRYYNYFLPTPDVFDAEDYRKRTWLKEDYQIVAKSLIRHLSFETVFDVGCAQGFLIEPLLEKGYEVRGIELSEDVLEVLPESLKGRVEVGDFSEARGTYDLICCVEVAEHLPPRRSQELVSQLCKLSTSHIYFTAAPPGQPGHGHINCRPHAHWIGWFRECGWELHESKTNSVRADLERLQHADWIQENSFVFRKR